MSLNLIQDHFFHIIGNTYVFKLSVSVSYVFTCLFFSYIPFDKILPIFVLEHDIRFIFNLFIYTSDRSTFIIIDLKYGQLALQRPHLWWIFQDVEVLIVLRHCTFEIQLVITQVRLFPSNVLWIECLLRQTILSSATNFIIMKDSRIFNYMLCYKFKFVNFVEST